MPPVYASVRVNGCLKFFIFAFLVVLAIAIFA